MNRRSFLGSILAAAAAPAIVRAESLMKMAPTESGILVYDWDASILDDYQEGFFEADVTDQLGRSVGLNTGVYTRVGNVVSVTGTITLKGSDKYAKVYRNLSTKLPPELTNARRHTLLDIHDVLRRIRDA